jgi:hypothetical protein
MCGHLRTLEGGRSREAVADHLIGLAEEDPNLVVGLDFAFSMPAWFVRGHGAASAPEFWEVVEREGPGWLASCPAPFYGHKGTKMPQADIERHRRTEKQSGAAKSVFQIAGSGQVGPGSIRGMPILRRLRDAGFCIWPFDSAELRRPLVVEIYPRLLTREVVKSNPDARRRHELVELGAGDVDRLGRIWHPTGRMRNA